MGTRSESGSVEESESRASATTGEPFDNGIAWQSGAVAGFVATVAMGVVIAVTDLPTLQSAIAGLYGFEGSLVAGWTAHLLHGTLFGLVFAAILSDPGLHNLTHWVWKTVLAGVVYGLVLAIVGAGFVMPIWLSAVGLDVGGPTATIDGPMVAWHAIYGFVLGGVYVAVERGELPTRGVVSLGT